MTNPIRRLLAKLIEIRPCSGSLIPTTTRNKIVNVDADLIRYAKRCKTRPDPNRDVVLTESELNALFA